MRHRCAPSPILEVRPTPIRSSYVKGCTLSVLLTSIGGDYVRIGIEAGPLFQWLVSGLTEADLPVVCVETRHMKALLKAQQVNKSDRNDARGIAQMMRVGLFKPVHVKTLVSQE
jgi:transposase